MKPKRIIEWILPFTLISCKKKEDISFPAWAVPVIVIYTKRKIWAICKKVINKY
jgi:hypothetical protein